MEISNVIVLLSFSRRSVTDPEFMLKQNEKENSMANEVGATGSSGIERKNILSDV